MDLVALIQGRINFIRRFYEKAARPFETTKHQIEKRKGRYQHNPSGYDPQDCEPPYLDDWFEADVALNVVGQSCLCLTQISFRDFLHGFVEQRGCARPNTKKNWFRKYKEFFRERYTIDWDKGPVDLAVLEDMCLTRNGIQHTQHHGRFYNLERKQTSEHRNRFPDSIFADDLDKRLFPSEKTSEPYRIKVTRDNLWVVLDAVEKFCAFLMEQNHS
jgi:hypothetical protein